MIGILVSIIGALYIVASLLYAYLAKRAITHQASIISAQLQRITELGVAAEQARLDAFHKGWQACEAKWRDEPLYQMGFETGKIGEYDRGYQAALHDHAAEACEMELARREIHS